jgi:glycine/serine hydroxymethyltransferase
MLHGDLNTVDPEIHALVEKERRRQFVGLELIASEVISIHHMKWIELHKCGSDASQWIGLDQQVF